MNAEMGFSKQSTSPTSTLEASAPGGIFLRNDVLPYPSDLKSFFKASAAKDVAKKLIRTLWTSPFTSLSLALRTIDPVLGLAAKATLSCC